jgi:hypothetical protein
MTPQAPAHPRVSLAIGAALLAGWLGTIGVAIASDGSAGSQGRASPAAAGVDFAAERQAASSSAGVESRAARPGRAGPGYYGARAD